MTEVLFCVGFVIQIANFKGSAMPAANRAAQEFFPVAKVSIYRLFTQYADQVTNLMVIVSAWILNVRWFLC